MKKIIPFRKDIIFKTNISEITSISLENTLSKEIDNAVIGEFIVSGEYKMSDESIHTESFLYELPFDIHLDEKYNLDNATIDVDDFYYEIINSNILRINIDVLVDRLEEKLIVHELEEVVIPRTNILEEEKNFMLDETLDNDIKKEESRCIENEEDIYELKEDLKISTGVSSLFDNIESDGETYKSYKVYIVREGDDLEFIMEKYGTTKEIIEQYNDLKEFKIGNKIIIPSQNESA